MTLGQALRVVGHRITNDLTRVPTLRAADFPVLGLGTPLVRVEFTGPAGHTVATDRAMIDAISALHRYSAGSRWLVARTPGSAEPMPAEWLFELYRCATVDDEAVAQVLAFEDWLGQPGPYHLEPQDRFAAASWWLARANVNPKLLADPARLPDGHVRSAAVAFVLASGRLPATKSVVTPAALLADLADRLRGDPDRDERLELARMVVGGLGPQWPPEPQDLLDIEPQLVAQVDSVAPYDQVRSVWVDLAVVAEERGIRLVEWPDPELPTGPDLGPAEEHQLLVAVFGMRFAPLAQEVGAGAFEVVGDAVVLVAGGERVLLPRIAARAARELLRARVAPGPAWARRSTLKPI